MSSSYSAVKRRRPSGLPKDSPTSMPATASPASTNLQNIHSSASPGNPGSVGAYQTHGTGRSDPASAGEMRKAVWPSTRKASPGIGRSLSVSGIEINRSLATRSAVQAYAASITGMAVIP